MYYQVNNMRTMIVHSSSLHKLQLLKNFAISPAVDVYTGYIFDKHSIL